MVTTRSQVVAVQNRPRRCLKRPVMLPRSTPVAKTLVQKRHQVNEKSKEVKQTFIPSRRAPLSRAPQLGSHVLFLFVGVDQQRQLLTIHTNLLPESTQSYIYSQNQSQPVYQLPDEDPTIVQIYRLYLYTNRIFSVSTTDQDTPDNGNSETHSDAEWTKLAHCYLLGLTLKDENFANASITAIIEKMKKIDRYPTGIANEVYTYTSEGDMLRKLIVDVHVFKGLGKWVRWPHDDAEGPREFVMDVVGGLAEVGEEIYGAEVEMPWEKKGACEYHSHVMTGRCD